MKALTGLIICMIFLPFQYAYCQKVKTKTNHPAQSHEPQVKWHQYSYPYYAILNNGPIPIGGCFINYKNGSYFVTSRHSFYTTTNERRKISNMMIFMDPENIKGSAKVLSINMSDQGILPVCFDFGCTDIILFPVNIPSEFPVNYVSLDNSVAIQGKEMAIVGYLKDSLHVIKTNFDSFLSRDSTYFLTDKSAVKDQSGSPVLMLGKTKTGSKIILAGVYSGKEISQELFDKGLISKASFIIRFLDSKTKKELLGKE